MDVATRKAGRAGSQKRLPEPSASHRGRMPEQQPASRGNARGLERGGSKTANTADPNRMHTTDHGFTMIKPDPQRRKQLLNANQADEANIENFKKAQKAKGYEVPKGGVILGGVSCASDSVLDPNSQAKKAALIRRRGSSQKMLNDSGFGDSKLQKPPLGVGGSKAVMLGARSKGASTMKETAEERREKLAGAMERRLGMQ